MTSVRGELYVFGGENSDLYPGKYVSTISSKTFTDEIFFAVYYNDLHRFDISTLNWTTLDVGSDVAAINEASRRPSPRDYLGLASTDTHLYVFGGWGGTGTPEPNHAALSIVLIPDLFLMQRISTDTLGKVRSCRYPVLNPSNPC
jgi:hypothetical protein